MRILYSMASIAPARGGPSTAAHAVARALVGQGHEVTIIGHDDGGTSGTAPFGEYEVRLFALNLRGWQLSVPYLWWCWRHIGEYDAVVINSLFLAHTFFVSRLCRARGVPYSIRPHGSLNAADLTRSRTLAKRVYLRLFDLPALRNAAYVFCTSEAEAGQVRRYRTAPVAVIPLGATAGEVLDNVRCDPSQILFLGRLTEKKGVNILLNALALLRADGEEFSAKIVGPADEGLREQYESMAADLGLHELVELGPFADQATKRKLFAQSGIFVLPSEDENFGIAVAEALACGLPVVVTPGVSHAGAVRQHRLGLVPRRSAEDVADALRQLLHLTEHERGEMSERASKYALEVFDWRGTARGLVSAFAAAQTRSSTVEIRRGETALSTRQSIQERDRV